MTKKSILNLIIDFIIMCILIFIDQYTKLIAVVYLKDQAGFPLISGVLEFNYLENRGAVF